jgi:excisionase family DNA binding protein
MSNRIEEHQLLIGTPAVARLLGVHRKTVRKLVDDGVLREIRFTPRSHPRFVRSEVVQLLTAGCGRVGDDGEGGL